MWQVSALKTVENELFCPDSAKKWRKVVESGWKLHMFA